MNKQKSIKLLNKAVAEEHIKDPKEMLKWAIKSEEEAMEMYNDFAVKATEGKDSGTKQIFEQIIANRDILRLLKRNMKIYKNSVINI